MNCEICSIITHPSVEEEQLRLFEGGYWRATLRQDQTLLGTCFITAKRHVATLSELSPNEWREFATITTLLETAIKEAFGAQVINTSCLMNLTFQDVKPNPHVHWHLKPRYLTPVTFKGKTFTDPSFGNYLDGQYPRLKVPRHLAMDIASKITRHIIN